MTTIVTPDNVATFVGNNKIFADTIQNFSANPTGAWTWSRSSPRRRPQGGDRLLKSASRRIPNVVANPRTGRWRSSSSTSPGRCSRCGRTPTPTTTGRCTSTPTPDPRGVRRGRLRRTGAAVPHPQPRVGRSARSRVRAVRTACATGGSWPVGSCWRRHSRRARTRATCTRSRPCGRDASARRKRTAAWVSAMLLAVGDTPTLAHAEVVDGKHVGTTEAEDQKHLDRPDADAAYRDQALDEILVRHPAAPAERGNHTRDASCGRGPSSPAPWRRRDPPCARTGARRRDHLLRRRNPAVAAQRFDTAEDGGRGFARDRLVGDRFEQRFVGRARFLRLEPEPRVSPGSAVSDTRRDPRGASQASDRSKENVWARAAMPAAAP